MLYVAAVGKGGKGGDGDEQQDVDGVCPARLPPWGWHLKAVCLRLCRLPCEGSPDEQAVNAWCEMTEGDGIIAWRQQLPRLVIGKAVLEDRADSVHEIHQ